MNQPEFILYPELLENNDWGVNNIILDNDTNLLENTDFNDVGYNVFNINNFNNLLTQLIQETIYSVTKKTIDIGNYHNEISDEEHTKIINIMPYKKTLNNDIESMCIYLEEYISNALNAPIKIFNDDLWIRICRPNCKDNNNTDFNPCHRDIYLDFYRNIVNIYLPICGSNELSSLKIQPGSHRWNENQTIVTKGGAYFKSTNKKYSVDAIIASKTPLEMIRPNPNYNQMMLFSPYLIHGCSDNANSNITRFSLEIRFIKDNKESKEQEENFNQFLKIRNWR